MNGNEIKSFPARFSLSNRFRKVTHEQFRDYIQNFHAEVERYFGVPCSLKLKALSNNHVCTGFLDDDLQREHDRINEAAKIMETDKIDDLHDIWNKAAYVSASIHPYIDEDSAPSTAFAQAEFKGHNPKRATFYVQPDGDDVKQDMSAKFWSKKVGDGFESHGNRDTRMPISPSLR